MIQSEQGIKIQASKINDNQNTITFEKIELELDPDSGVMIPVNRAFTIHLDSDNTIKLIKQLILLLITGSYKRDENALMHRLFKKHWIE